ncbi:MAG: hypothetical protein HY692_00150, partial [Cyanobacteria bacterium NC_groundwater_1444_Ag_S-0.65um_54_12]|nr:hypothetical protein [Cyanobacteria bacterium NC_groundwater_1444_Ag_S-0.65um_54_12]
LKLPLRIAGRNAKGDEFNLQITSLDLHPTFGKYDFMAVPPGYTEIVTETVGNE